LETTVTILAWHNSPNIKAEVLNRMVQHRKADEIVRGVYQEIDPDLTFGYRGCLIGCTLPKQPISSESGSNSPFHGWHAEVEIQYGIEKSVGHLLDSIFEGLPDGRHAEFAVASIEAIPVGADLSTVPLRLMLDAMTLVKGAMASEDGKTTIGIDTVIELLRQTINGTKVSGDIWRSAAKVIEDENLLAPAGLHSLSIAARLAAAFAISPNGEYGQLAMRAMDRMGSAMRVHWAHGAQASLGYERLAAEASEKYWTWVADRILVHLSEAGSAVIKE